MGGRHRTDEPEDGYGQYPPPRTRRRRAGRGTVLAPLAGAVALAVLLGVAAFVIVNRDHGCTGEELAVRVTASPDIQPVLSTIADDYNKAGRTVDGRCVTVTVKQRPSATMAAALGSATSTSAVETTDVWVPDSSLWLGELKSKGAELPAASASAARSPIVLVTSSAVAPDLQASLGKVSWSSLVSAANVADPDGLAKKVRVLALDPVQNAAGLGAMLAASGVLSAQGQEDQLVGALKQLSQSVARTPEALLSSLAVKSGRAPIGVASEQAVWSFNAGKSGGPAVPLYPAEGTISLDYPVVVTTKDPAVSEAAQAFVKELSGETAQSAIRAQGFRTPDGKGGDVLNTDGGFSAAAPRALPVPGAEAVASMAQSWSRLNLGTRLLALFDVSGTMALPVPGAGMSRMQAISKIALEGFRLFPADSEIGAWEFSTHLDGRGVDYREMVPVGPITENVDGTLRKDLLTNRLATIKAKPTGDTGLNDTLAAAYERMSEEYQPDKINTILVLTDGAGNDDPDGGISNSEILRRLKTQYDPAKPVSILIIAFGPDAPKGKRSMEALAKATGGELFIAKDVLEVRKFFLEGMKRRLCAPHCDG
ncbi:hypothetical protein Misp01_74890 [Microtetraspora sp. NBRC 13810]|uniref:substrate-binding and VWA domain-containing protein n=1 Tax=Microtetraspora sp. NBRC 13810 TaxID=3030990 RepID=UPI0024A52515|nr:substrate-binding and VWA domain-containing protein [Microtetraspora sp. NBRC 13810]GLW12361.1 hypothetical protein Misp01_74890 [Microtetraspora sp. NBRC 13810]